MARSERKELRLTPEMVEAIDRARGDVSFNRWAERAFEEALGLGHGAGASATRVGRDGASPSGAAEPSRPVSSPPASPRVPDDRKAPSPAMQRGRDLVGRDTAAMERQRKMNEAKGL